MKQSFPNKRMSAQKTIILDRLYVSSRGSTLGEMEQLKVMRPTPFKTKNARGSASKVDSLTRIIEFGEEDALDFAESIRKHQAQS